jgi:L-lactate utilization protein LutB
MALQLIGHNDPRHIVAPALHQDIEHMALLIDNPPQRVALMGIVVSKRAGIVKLIAERKNTSHSVDISSSFEVLTSHWG